MKRKVTAEHIKEGKPQEVAHCPIGLMLKECYPGEKINVDVLEAGTVPSVMVGSTELVFTNPDSVAVFITRFDNGKIVKPFFIEWEDF